MKLIIDVPENIYEALKKAEAIISGQRSGKSLTSIIFDAVAKGTPLNHAFKTIKDGIKEEADYAYADFDKYKVDYLGVDSRYVEDELPYDDFRYGMERCIDIIDKYRNEVSE